jgi:hypothetical protein
VTCDQASDRREHDVADDFGRWYPGFTHTSDATLDDQPAAA